MISNKRSFDTKNMYLGKLYVIDNNGLQDDEKYSLLERIPRKNQYVNKFRVVRRGDNIKAFSKNNKNIYVTDRSIAPDTQMGKYHVTNLHTLFEYMENNEVANEISLNRAISIQNKVNRMDKEYRAKIKRLIRTK